MSFLGNLAFTGCPSNQALAIKIAVTERKQQQRIKHYKLILVARCQVVSFQINLGKEARVAQRCGLESGQFCGVKFVVSKQGHHK